VLLCVWLTVKNKIATWPWGSFRRYAKLFFDLKLYASMELQALYFIPTSFWAWWSGSSSDPAITTICRHARNKPNIVLSVIGVVVVTIALGRYNATQAP